MSQERTPGAKVLAGHVALVTGAGRGIGRGIAVALAEAGATLAVNDLPSSPDLPETVRAIEDAGGRAFAVPCDVTDQAAVEAIVEETVAQAGGLDIAVTCAAYSDREPFHTANMDGFRRTVDVTMWGAFYLLRAAANSMINRGVHGSIVAISSPHAEVPVPTAMAYNLSKAAVDHMARTAAIELVSHGIRVNIIHPGWIDTPGERKFFTEDQIARSAARLPMHRLGTPAEIGRGVVFLCDPASEYITGSMLRIDGGITLPWWTSPGSGAPPA